MNKHFSQYTVLLLLILTTNTASAHTGAYALDGFISGFTHPLLGIDHLLVMLGLGLWASRLSTTKAALAITGFLGFMFSGALLALSGLIIQGVEIGIMLSVVFTGLLLSLTPLKSSANLSLMLICAFALFHGFAHGAELPLATNANEYATGFISATLLLHLSGLGLGRTAKRWQRDDLIRIGGGLTCGFGVWLLLGV